jgi:hypothetical protein
MTPQISLVNLGSTKIIAQFNVCYLLSAEYTQKITEVYQDPTESIYLFQRFQWQPRYYSLSSQPG